MQVRRGEVQVFDLKGKWEGTAYRDRGGTYSVMLGHEAAVFGTENGSRAEMMFSVEAEDDQNVRVSLGGGKPLRGIYKLERGQLYLCFSFKPGNRPTSFTPGLDEVLWILQRPRLRN
jgi:hypothetical protein